MFVWIIPMPFLIHKDNTGNHRWILVSSSAYRDSDGEIVSTKALEGAVALADETGSRGPLLWWHEPELVLGSCDFQGCHGRFLIESGVFASDAIGAAVRAHADNLQASIGFDYPTGYPDKAGVFGQIKIFERSLVPAGRAANPFTRLVVKETNMLKEKIAKFKELFGAAGEAALNDVLASVDGADLAAQKQGLAFKAVADLETDEAKAVDMVSDEIVEEIAEPEESAETARTVSTMTANELAGAIAPLIGQAIAEALSPLIGALDVQGQMKKITGDLETKMTGMLGSYAKTKDDEASARAQQIEQLQATFKASQDQQAQIASKLAELMGDQPKATKGYRASEDSRTVVTDEARIKDMSPHSDPVLAFFNDVPGVRPGA